MAATNAPPSTAAKSSRKCLPDPTVRGPPIPYAYSAQPPLLFPIFILLPHLNTVYKNRVGAAMLPLGCHLRNCERSLTFQCSDRDTQPVWPVIDRDPEPSRILCSCANQSRGYGPRHHLRQAHLSFCRHVSVQCTPIHGSTNRRQSADRPNPGQSDLQIFEGPFTCYVLTSPTKSLSSTARKGIVTAL